MSFYWGVLLKCDQNERQVWEKRVNEFTNYDFLSTVISNEGKIKMSQYWGGKNTQIWLFELKKIDNPFLFVLSAF